jgi:hypothetical protein
VANNWLGLAVALIFAWLRMMLAISFLEAPLKFAGGALVFTPPG